MRYFAKLASLAIASVGVAYGDAIPFSVIRLRKPHTDREEVWNGLREQFAKYRAGVDEVPPPNGSRGRRMTCARSAFCRRSRYRRRLDTATLSFAMRTTLA